MKKQTGKNNANKALQIIWTMSFALLAAMISMQSAAAFSLAGITDEVYSLTGDDGNHFNITSSQTNESFPADLGYRYEQFRILSMPIWMTGRGEFVAVPPNNTEGGYYVLGGIENEIAAELFQSRNQAEDEIIDSMIQQTKFEKDKNPMYKNFGLWFASHWGILVTMMITGGYVAWKKGKEEFWW